MADTQQAWDDVSARFRALAGEIRDRFASQRGDAETPGDRDAVERALRTLGDAVEQTVESVGSAVRDPAFRDQAREAARTLGDAIRVTFSEVGGDMRDKFGRRSDAPDVEVTETRRTDTDESL